jgi:hypothetical protein
MNKHVVCTWFVATIGATLALAIPAAFAAKPAPQPPPNPCIGAQSRGFPALVFTRQRTTGGHVYYDTILADATGQCQKTVYVADGFAPSFPGSDVNLRHTSADGAGLIVRGGGAPGLTIAMSRYTVFFTTSGEPEVTVEPGGYSTVLALADLTVPAELSGWSKYVMATPLISPDGTKMLITVAFRQVQGPVETVMTTHWTCPFDSLQQQSVDALSCQMVHRGAPGVSPSAGWGGRSDTVYITDTALSGATRSLYRLNLATQTLNEIWSLGTMFNAAKGRIDLPSGRELVAVHEWNSSGCNRVLVIDGDSCPSGGCTILNGNGNPARTLSWLPDRRVVGQGQTKPNRKGQCSASGSIVVFDADDTNATTNTTITPVGSYPDGAGGG